MVLKFVLAAIEVWGFPKEVLAKPDAWDKEITLFSGILPFLSGELIFVTLSMKNSWKSVIFFGMLGVCIIFLISINYLKAQSA